MRHQKRVPVVYRRSVPQGGLLAPVRQALKAVAVVRQTILSQMLTPRDYRGGTVNEAKGKLAVRMPDEPVDDRPVVVIRHPFWRDRVQAALYTEVTRQNPQKQGETRFQYIVRLAELADKEYRAEMQHLAEARK